MNHKQTLAMLFSSVALLSACGGGGDDPAPVPAPAATDAVPDTATASTAGLKTYLVALSKDLTETKDALDVASVMLKTAEDTEPDPVD